MTDQQPISTRELALILGKSVQALNRQAAKENWPSEVINQRGEKQFSPQQLPPHIRARVYQSRESVYQKGLILPTRGDLDLAHAKSLLNMFESAPEWSRRKAEARGEIIEAFNRFAQNRGLTESKKLFVNRYNQQNPNLGISEPTYLAIKRISRASLDLWRSKYKDLGLAGLLDSTTRGKPSGKITDEMGLYIIGILSNRITTRPRRVFEYVENKFSGSGTPVPSEATVRRFITRWKNDNHSLVTFMKNPDQWRSTYQAAFGDASIKAAHFLHMIEFDNTPADIMCSDNKRYTITGAIDIFSRKAKCLVVPVARSQAIASLMRWIILNWGLFDVMITDNGKDYASKHIEAACGALGIEPAFTPPFTPEAKPHIERFLGVMSSSLFEELGGYIGHSVADRKAIESQKSFAQRMFNKDEVIECRLTADQLQEAIDTWIEKVYHQREHGSLRKSPEARAAESTATVKRILDERILDILLSPVGKPIVQNKGIRYQRGYYTAPELANHIKEKVQIRRDMDDAGKLYVFDQSSKFICIAKDASLEGLSVEDFVVARKRQNKRVREQARALKSLARSVGDPMADLLESKRAEKGQIFAIHRQETFENQPVREAAKAVFGPESKDTFEPDLFEADEQKKVVPIREEPVFQHEFKRLRYLEDQAKIRTLTDEEQGWMAGYKCTEEYHELFVAPYQ